MASPLSDLHKWYAAQCDENWEHTYGIYIQTVDNPGWWVAIDLADTLLEHKPFEPYEERISDNFWITLKVENKRFVGSGDTTRLEQILSEFVNWAKTEPNWLAVPTEELHERKQDELFWEQLGEEVGPKTCVDEGCTRLRVAYSVLCRKHHFEVIRNKDCPFEG